MSRVCKKHQEHPVTIYSQCIGCEVEMLNRRIEELEARVAELEDARGDYFDSLPSESEVYGNDCRDGRCET